MSIESSFSSKYLMTIKINICGIQSGVALLIKIHREREREREVYSEAHILLT
jgi:hypothetical protein